MDKPKWRHNYRGEWKIIESGWEPTFFRRVVKQNSKGPSVGFEYKDIWKLKSSDDDKDKTLLKYYAKTIFFDLAYSKQRYQGNQAGNNDVKIFL